MVWHYTCRGPRHAGRLVGREHKPDALAVRIVPRVIGRDVSGHMGSAFLFGLCRHRLLNPDPARTLCIPQPR